MTTPIIVGLLVGGGSRRMGRPKGLIAAPDGSGQTLVERLARQAVLGLGDVPVVLVGERTEYAHLPFPTLADALPDRGPLGGLVALLRHARQQGAESVIALACDHPFIDAELIGRLAQEHPQGRVCCPMSEGRAEPLVARYRVDVLSEFERALEQGRLSLQPLLRSAGLQRLELNETERQLLVDWDTEADIRSS